MKNIKEVLQAGHQWMEEYMQSFYCEDKDIMFGIKMKEKHTGYVTTMPDNWLCICNCLLMMWIWQS